MAIDYPEQPTGKDKALAVGRAAVESIPWLGPALNALGPIFPDRFKEDDERWKREVTDELNDLARACRRPTISRDSLAWLFALLAGKLDADGTGDVFVSHEEWETRFPNSSRAEVAEALARLSNARWIESQSNANSPSGIGGFCGTSLLFAHTHPWLHQLYPSQDAKEIAAFALEDADPDADAISAMQIQEHYGWQRQRLYPALAYLVDEIVPAAAVERHYHPEYPFIWLYLNGEVRRTLREFAGSQP